MTTFKSDISGEELPVSSRVPGKNIRASILKLIQKDHPQINAESNISEMEYNIYREKYISYYLTQQKGELNALENTVIDTLKEEATISNKLDSNDDQESTFGQRIADKVATFGGSWTFIISFGIFLLLWILTNIIVLSNKSFDPYPFILLNLILSCIAAMQAPVIMMSQNRQEEKDRERAKNDYMINLKSELEIRTLHEKIDHLILQQQTEFIELQKVQIEMMTDIMKRMDGNNQ